MERAKILDTLKQARALISHPDAFSQGFLACDAAGAHLSWEEILGSRAVKFCERGAITHVLGCKPFDKIMFETEEPLRRAARRLFSEEALGSSDDDPFGVAVRVNNWLGHAATMKMFDEAIAQLEQEVAGIVVAAPSQTLDSAVANAVAAALAT